MANTTLPPERPPRQRTSRASIRRTAAAPLMLQLSVGFAWRLGRPRTCQRTSAQLGSLSAVRGRMNRPSELPVSAANCNRRALRSSMRSITPQTTATARLRSAWSATQKKSALLDGRTTIVRSAGIPAVIEARG